MVVTVAATRLPLYTYMFRVRENGDPEVRFLARWSASDWTHLSLSSLARGRRRSALAPGPEGER